MANVKNRSTINVMIVGPGPQTEGGITEVIRRIQAALQKNEDISSHWIAMHRSGSLAKKFLAAVKGIIDALRFMPKANIVHIHSSARVSFYRKSVIFWISRLWRKPVIWHLHAPNDDFLKFFGNDGMSGTYARKIIRKCERVVVLSESWRTLVAPYIDADKVQVIANPIPDMTSDETGIVQREEGRILYLAHLIQRKGYPLLIEAFASLVGRYPGARLVFAGSGEVDQAAQMCVDYRVSQNVDFLGWIGEPARSIELKKAMIFALPSYQEGLPMGILEAMAFGLAVVVTPVGGIGDVVVQNRNGILVSPGAVDELAAALDELLSSSEKCLELGARARQSVSIYTAENISIQWISMYSDVMSEQGKAISHGH